MGITITADGISIGKIGKPRFATLLLALSMFMTGACGLISEYVLSTVSTYILGNSIEQFSVIIALMMLMMGLAAYAQRYISDENLVEKFILIECFIALIGGFAPIAIYAAFGFMENHFALVQYFFVCSMGALVGMEIPLVLRINEKYSKTLGINMASIYSPDYIGSFVGAIVWVFFLIKTFPLTEISFLVAGINFVIAFITFAYFMKHGLVKAKFVSLIIIGLTAVGLFYGYMHNRVWDKNLEQRLYEDKIVFSETTKYQRLVMTYRKDINEYRFYINGHLQFSSVDEAIYHEQLIHPVMSMIPDHKRVLILGGGDGMALREVLKYKDVESVTLVDLDPAMVNFCSTNPILKKLNKNSFADSRVRVLKSNAITSGGLTRPVYQETGKMKTNKGKYKEIKEKPETQNVARVDVYNVDADKFIGEISEKWNVVIVDFPDPNAIELVKLYSKEFFLKLNRVLAENGMVSIQSTSPYHAKEAYLCIKRTIEAAGFNTIPYHDNVPSFGDWGWLLASKKQLASSNLEKRISNLEIEVETNYLTAEVFQRARIFGKNWLTSKYSDVNTLMYPILLQRYTKESWEID